MYVHIIKAPRALECTHEGIEVELCWDRLGPVAVALRFTIKNRGSLYLVNATGFL